MSAPPQLSVILPVGGGTVALADVVARYGNALTSVGLSFEVLLVPAPVARPACLELARVSKALVVTEAPDSRWGSAVKAGLRSARGEVLCYADWTQTAPEALSALIGYSVGNPELVFRANRRTRASVIRRLGSLAFNLECRVLLGITAWDVNGSPKVFRRRHAALLELSSDSELLDAEFAARCEAAGYTVVEVPVQATPLMNRSWQPDVLTALRMLARVPLLRRRLRDRGVGAPGG